MRNLPATSSSPSGRDASVHHTRRKSMSEVDGATLMARSLKQQGINHLFGVVGFPVGPIAAAAHTLALEYPDVVVLRGARFTWISDFSQSRRYGKRMHVIDRAEE